MEKKKREKLEGKEFRVGSAADPGISLDMMIKALLRLGTSNKQIGKFLGEVMETN